MTTKINKLVTAKHKFEAAMFIQTCSNAIHMLALEILDKKAHKYWDDKIDDIDVRALYLAAFKEFDELVGVTPGEPDND